MPENLLLDNFPFRLLSTPRLVESSHTQGKQVLEVTGVFQNYLLKNSNGRVYPKRIWERVFSPDSDFTSRLKRRNVLGMIEHPKDGITLVTEASHVITDVHIATESEIANSNGNIEEGDIIGTYEVLPSEFFPKAKILEGAIKAKIDFGGVSSRGNGTVTETPSALEVNDDYMLETWDVVFTPSVKRAKPSVKSAFESAQPSASTIKEDDDSGRDPYREGRFQTYAAWKKTMKENGATKFEGDSDICLAVDADGRGVGEWDGEKGNLYSYSKSTKNESNDMKCKTCKSETCECDKQKKEVTESSFPLVTGLYGPEYKAGSNEFGSKKKMIPIQLVHDKPKNKMFWQGMNEGEEAPKLGFFETMQEAIDALKDLCKSNGHIFETVSDNKPTNIQTNTNKTMNPQDRIRQIQAEAVMLANSKRKGLKLSEAASLLEHSKSLRIELAQIEENHSTLSTLVSPIKKKLVEFEDELDAPLATPEADKETEKHGDMGDEKSEEKGGEKGDMTAEEASDIIAKAIDELEKHSPEVAAELKDVQDQISQASHEEGETSEEEHKEHEMGGEEEHGENAVDLDDIPPAPMGAGKLESIKARKTFIEGYAKLRSRYARLSESAARLLTAYKNLNESNHKGEDSAQLKEAEERAAKSEAAAHEIAARYNTEMIEFGEYVWKMKKPELYEAHKKELSECRTWKSYDELSRKIVAEDESRPASEKSADKTGATVTESAPEKKEQPVTESAKTQTTKPIEESVHPMVASITRSRQHITPFSNL